MKLLNLIKKNRSLLNLTILISIGWLFLTIFAIVFFFRGINDNTEYEIAEMTSHYEVLFSDYNNRIRLVTAYYTEHSESMDQSEFIVLAQNVIEDNTTIDHVSIAPAGVIEYIYPLEYSDEIGFDIMQNASIHENAILLESIENDVISYQYNIVEDKVEDILIRKPIFIDEVFYGFITFYIDSEVFATAGFTNTSDFLSSALYTDNDEFIYGRDDFDSYTIHVIQVDDVEIHLGESIRTDYLLNRTSYLLGYILTVTLILLLIFVVLSKVFVKFSTVTEELTYRKNYDVETNLYNIDRLYIDVAKDIIDKKVFYLSFININNVKYINEKFGHIQTSELLLKTASMINRVLRNNSKLYRYGGDEYVLVTNTDSVSEIKNLLRRIVKIFESDIVVGSIRTRLGLSIGIAHYPSNGYSAEELIKNAHLTATQIGNHDKEGFQFYRHDRINDMMLNEDFDKLVAGLNFDLFEVYLMPIIDCQTNIISGFECLTRVFDDLGKQLHTEDVVLSLERNGKIQYLDENVFRKMLSIMKRLNKEFPERDLFLSLNASALSLNDEYVDNVIRMYKNARLKKGQIILELTESYQVEDYDYLIELFKKLNSHGIKIGIDDFGSGYSSISYISKFPIYAIKVDKEYVRDYRENDFNRTLLKTLQSIAGVLNCKLVAEGVDSPETLEFLKEEGCPFYQGYLFSKGVPFDDAVALLKNNFNKNKG